MVITSNYIRNSFIASSRERRERRTIRPVNHKERIDNELAMLGTSSLARSSMEAHYLPNVIADQEHLKAVVFGYDGVSFAMLLATDLRIIYLDRKPLFMKLDEIRYDIVSGATINRYLVGTKVILHTPIRDYGLLTINKKCATDFRNYIEVQCLDTVQTNEDDQKGD